MFIFVSGKGDYSNQMLITSDDWEIDCRQLKFASPIGQGAFGKVVTGYYKDQRVAIKLVRGEILKGVFCLCIHIEAFNVEKN